MAYEKQNFTNGQTLTAEHLNHIEDGLHELSNVQPDYDQNDSTAADYIKNRPFYSEKKTRTFVDYSFELAEGDDFDGWVYFESGNGFLVEEIVEIEEGAIALIELDGVVYETPLHYIPDNEDPNGWGNPLVGGNLAILNEERYEEDASFPFAFIIYPGNICIISVNTESYGVGSHSIKVVCDVINQVQLDSKYVASADIKAAYGEPGHILNNPIEKYYYYDQKIYQEPFKNGQLYMGSGFWERNNKTSYVHWNSSNGISGDRTETFVSYLIYLYTSDGLLGTYEFNIEDDNTFSAGGISFTYTTLATDVDYPDSSPAYIETSDTSIVEASIYTKELYQELLGEEYISSEIARVSDLGNKANKSNPVFTGSFSQNRRSNTTIGDYSHAEGLYTTASGKYSHAEGYATTASGESAHAEGWNTYTYGGGSHAEGKNTNANGNGAHAEGVQTIARGSCQHSQGKYNVEDSGGVYAHIVGNGTDNSRSNAHTLDWSGNAWFAGDVYVGSTSGTNKDDGSVKLATVDEVVPAPSTASVGQVVAVKAVDENGKPTEWEAVDMSGGDKWELLAEVEASEDVSGFDIKFSYKCKKIKALIYSQMTYSDGSDTSGIHALTPRFLWGDGTDFNSQATRLFYTLNGAGSSDKFYWVCVEVDTSGPCVTGTMTKFIGANSGGTPYWHVTEYTPSQDIAGVTFGPHYKYVSDVGSVGRFCAGSKVIVYGVKA